MYDYRVCSNVLSVLPVPNQSYDFGVGNIKGNPRRKSQENIPHH